MGGRGGALGRPAAGVSYHDMTDNERDTLMRQQWAGELRAMGLDPSDISYVKNKAYEMGRGYVATSSSFGINDALRDGTPLTHTQAEVVSRMDIATNKTLGADLNLVRYVGGTKYLPQVLGVTRGSLLRMNDVKLTELSTSVQGKIITEKGYMSTSYNVKKNVFSHLPVQLRIRAPKNAKGFITDNKAESEIVLPRNTQYVINKVSRVMTSFGGRRIIIDVTIIPQ